MKKLLSSFLLLAFALVSSAALAAWGEDESVELDRESKEVLAEILAENSSVQKYMDLAVGYAVFPTVGKGGFGIGGARGKGVLYENGAITAVVTLSQLTIGFQAGGQAYSEFIFFENQATLNDFKQGNYELGAQASAVALTAGVSADAEFINGMAILTKAKGGLMYEATVGGQKFKIEPK